MNETFRWQLINAALNGDGQRLRSLLSKQVRIDFTHVCQLFHLAAACGSTDNLKTLLAFVPSINVNCRDKVGCTALHKAASAGHREAIHFLIYHGAQIDVQEYIYGNSPLHEVASKGFSRSVEALCISRASPNLQNKLGLAPLHVAAQNGHKQSIRVLLFCGADLGITDKFGNTCLHTAVRYGRTGAVKILLAASANVMATNRNMETPLHIAASLKRTKIARYLLAANTGRESVAVMGTLARVSGGDRQIQPSSPLPLLPHSPPSAVQSALWMRNLQGETPLEVAKRRLRGDSGRGINNMITLLLGRMNVAEGCSQYENVTTKSFHRPSISSGDDETGAPDALPATPYISTDLICSPVQKQATPRFALKTSTTNRLHCPQIIEADNVPTSYMDETTAPSPAYLFSGLKTKSQSFRHSLLGGLFKRERSKASPPVSTGEMKKSKSSHPHALGISKCTGNTETPPLKMATSISVSEALNGSHSSSSTGRSILQEISLSTDDPLQDSLLLGRFQQLPLPQNSESTSAGMSRFHPSDDVTATNSCSNGDQIPSRPTSLPRPNPTVCASLSGCASGSGEGGGCAGVGGSVERTRSRFVVRFDLDAGGDAHADPTPAAHGRQLPMQLYRDLDGNLKENPAVFASGCDCVQRQADYFAGKVPDFVLCATHNYLGFRASSTDMRSAKPHGTRKSGPSRVGTTNNTTAISRTQWMRSRSDESLSIRGRVGKEHLTSSAPPLKMAAMKKDLLPADSLPDTCTRNSNGRLGSSTYEDATAWPPSGHAAQPTLSNGEVSQESTSQQKMTKSKSYSGQTASVVDAAVLQAPNGGLINTQLSRQEVITTPLYMSCRNIGGKMGLSVGRFPSPLPTLMPTNGAR